jgi:hypothetical protein
VPIHVETAGSSALGARLSTSTGTAIFVAADDYASQGLPLPDGLHPESSPWTSITPSGFVIVQPSPEPPAAHVLDYAVLLAGVLVVGLLVLPGFDRFLAWLAVYTDERSVGAY